MHQEDIIFILTIVLVLSAVAIIITLVNISNIKTHSKKQTHILTQILEKLNENN